VVSKAVNHAAAGTVPISAAQEGQSGRTPEAPARESGPLDRYISVLELVAAFPGTLTLTDVAALLDLPKTSAHRLLGGLSRAGLIEGGSGRGRAFSLGDRLLRLVHMSAEDGWIAALARPFLHALVEDTGETCYLTRLVGHRVPVVVSESPEVHWRSYVKPGLEMPPHAAATAKAILAFQPEAVVARAIAEPLPRFTDRTRIDPDWIRREYATIREAGYATCVGEIDEGLAALGVPIVQKGGAVFHCVGMTGPLPRIMNEDLPVRIARLTATATRLSTLLTIGSAIATRSPDTSAETERSRHDDPKA